MTAIAVTGASGFVGREMVRFARRAGCSVIEVGRIDIAGDLEKRLRGCDWLIHLAARAHVLDVGGACDAAEFERINVELTRQIACAARKAQVTRFVYVSSAGVLGRASPPAGFSDDSPAAPHDAYTRSKFAGEEMLQREFGDELELVVARPPLVYGPEAPGNFGRLLGLVKRGWPLPFGGLSAPRSMVGLRNLCDFLWLAATHPAAPGLRALVADAEASSVAELVIGLGRALGRPARIVTVPQPALQAAFSVLGRATDFERLASPFLLRPHLAHQCLGWIPPYGFADELAWAVDTARTIER